MLAQLLYVFACLKVSPAHERKQKLLIKILPRGWPLVPLPWKICSTFYRTIFPLVSAWRLICTDAPTSTLPSPLQPSPLSAPCLVHTTTSTSVSTLSMHRKRLHSLCGVLEGESGEQEQETKYACLSLWKLRSVFVHKTGGVFIVLHLWDNLDVDRERDSGGDEGGEIWLSHVRAMSEW